MEEYKIRDNNTLIAKFMGMETEKDHALGETISLFKTRRFMYNFSEDDFLKIIGKEDLEDYMVDIWDNVEDLNYHKSLDALLPVIDKIEDINIGCQAYIGISAFNISAYSSGHDGKGLKQFIYELNGRKFAGQDKIEAGLVGNR